MKKIMSRIAALTAAGMMALFGLAGCGSSGGESSGNTTTKAAETEAATTEENENTEAKSESAEPAIPTKDIKIGLICLHDENSTYDLNFISALETVKNDLKLTDEQIIIKKNIPESNECKEAAIDLADHGCNIVFADSFGHESYLLEAAKEYPEVHFCHATGTLAHTEKLDNFHNAFASIYQGRYLAGIAAGLKLNDMISEGKITEDQAVMGYVGAYTYAEVISGYTAFYLGAKSVCPSVTMKVRFTGSWYDETAEKEAATTLISDGCVLISQHADSMGAPTACENAGVPNISYNGSTVDSCPNTFIVSSRINWAPYYEYVIDSYLHNDKLDYDWVGSLNTKSVQLTAINTNVASATTHDMIEEATQKLNEGSLHVFDTSTFTVNGETLTSYMADVDTDDAYTPDTEVISDGYFHESEYRSAPYFDLRIDGITTLNEMF